MISIIIPLYNKEETIKGTLESILSQTYKDLEIVVVNDGSTDNSINIVKSIEDSRIKLISQTNMGVSAARNRGVLESCGEWLLFLDADDSLLENALYSLHNAYKKNEIAQIISGNYINITKKHKPQNACKNLNEGIIDDPFFLLWDKCWNIRLGSFMAKRKSCIDTGGFNENICIGEDFLFIIKLLKDNVLVHTNESIMNYNQINSSLSRKKIPYSNHVEKYFVFPPDNQYLCACEYDMLFKHIFRGFIRMEPKFSFKLLIQYWKKLHVMIMVEFMRLGIIKRI